MLIVKCGIIIYTDTYHCEQYTRLTQAHAIYVLSTLRKAFIFCSDFSAADVFVTKLHTHSTVEDEILPIAVRDAYCRR